MAFLWTLLTRVLALYIGLLASLGSMSLAGQPTAMFLWRVLVSYGTLCVCALYGVVASIVLRLLGRGGMAQWATSQSFRHGMRLAAGVRFRVLGEGRSALESTRPAVFVGNHQTALDVLLLAEVWPHWCSVTAKKSLKYTPFLGWFMALSGTVFLDRGNRDSTRSAFDGAATEIRDRRQSVFIFPEGTRSNADTATLLPFKKGAFHLAIKARVPVVPIVSACYAGVLSLKHWRFRRGTIPVVVLPPIPTDNLEPSDADQLCNYVRERMLHALTVLTDSPLGQQAFLADPPPLQPSESWSSVPPPVQAKAEERAGEAESDPGLVKISSMAHADDPVTANDAPPPSSSATATGRSGGNGGSSSSNSRRKGVAADGISA